MVGVNWFLLCSWVPLSMEDVFLGLMTSLCKSKYDERVSQGQKILDALVVLHDASCLFLAFTEITIPVSHSGCARLPCRCVRRGYSTFAGVNRPDIAFRVVARSSCQKKKCAKSSQLRLSNACDICSRFFLCNFYSFLYFICLMSWKRNVLSWGSDRKLPQGTHASRACVTDTAPATFRLSLRRRAGKSSSSTAKAWKISRKFSGSKMVWLWPEKYW